MAEKKKDYHKGVRTTIYLPEELNDELENLQSYLAVSESMSYSKSELIRIAIKAYLNLIMQ